MATRNPLVLVAGAISELPAGDALTGVSGGGSSVVRYTVVGSLAQATNGLPRWYPDRTIHITSVYFSMGIAPLSSFQIDILKNGTSIFSGSKPTCGGGSYKSSVISLDVTVTSNDYLTVSVPIASGSDMSVSLVYL